VLPEKYRKQRYQVMMHQSGLEIGHEGPGIPCSLAEGIPTPGRTASSKKTWSAASSPTPARSAARSESSSKTKS
jgi:hypothetical protein